MYLQIAVILAVNFGMLQGLSKAINRQTVEEARLLSHRETFTDFRTRFGRTVCQNCVSHRCCIMVHHNILVRLIKDC